MATTLMLNLTLYLRKLLENPPKMIHQSKENLLIDWLRWDLKTQKSQDFFGAFPSNKGKENKPN